MLKMRAPWLKILWPFVGYIQTPFFCGWLYQWWCR